MKRFIVCVVLMLFCFAMPTAAPAAPPTPTCLACLHACTGQGKNTPACLWQCVTSGACIRP
jgi:hypothetical protein